MSDLAIVTDSTSDLPDDLLRRYEITAIPLTVDVGGRSYRDRVDLAPDQFYDLLEAQKGVHRTSQPSPGVFLDVYRQLVKTGKKVIAIHLSSVLSGTCRTAELARQHLIDQGVAGEEDVTVVDSLNGSMGMGWQVLAAAEAAGLGKGREEVLRLIERVRERVKLFLHVSDLEYLHRGGRVGAVSALLGSLLNITPLLTVVNGGVVAAAKLRGKQQVVRKYVELVGEAWAAAQAAGSRFYLSVMHAHALEEARALRDRLVKQLVLAEQPLLVETGPVIGGHVGPGSVGVAYYW
ncbi:MAG: DegV family protein [Bacillota bacterium]|nr:DegV family protein [Bacillota bacterium]